MSLLSQFTTAFVMHGFQFWYNPERNGSGFSYKGILKTLKFGDVEVEFYFHDQTLTTLPKAYILSRSNKKLQPYHFPHLDGQWELCYDDGTKVFDKYRTEDMVEFCILSITSILDNIKPHDMNEIISEFRSYWKSDLVYYGVVDKDKENINLFDKKTIISESDIWRFDSKGDFSFPLIEIDHIPSFESIEWPINNIATLESWLSEYNGVYKKIVNYSKMKIKKYIKLIPIIFHSIQKDLYFGMFITIKHPLLSKESKPVLQDKTINKLWTESAQISERIWIDNYSAKIILRSNGYGDNIKDLSNKRILLIGAGTIGSNLANILIRNGAGTGRHGSLTLVDNDIFEPYNFSRHFLGLNSSDVPKVDALMEELLRLAPFCRIIPDKRSIYKFPIKANKYDLIIDSTGEEALTMWLNDLFWKLQKRNNGIAPLFLSVWVKGMGEAVECFSKQDNRQACHECFRMSEYPVKKSDQALPLRDSCRSIYVPFPVTVSLYASLLAIHVINKWLDRDLETSNYFRQKINPVGSIEEFLIPTNKECPTCGNNYIEE